MDLGQMVLIFDEVLVARSSGKILFFKQEYSDELETNKWVLYH
jgi:hypothetical protein